MIRCSLNCDFEIKDVVVRIDFINENVSEMLRFDKMHYVSKSAFAFSRKIVLGC